MLLFPLCIQSVQTDGQSMLLFPLCMYIPGLLISTVEGEREREGRGEESRGEERRGMMIMMTMMLSVVMICGTAA